MPQVFDKTITANEIKNLCLFINRKYGCDFSMYAMNSLKRRLIRILSIFDIHTIDQLINKLEAPELFEKFITELTVNTTEMFRDPSFWKQLRKIISSKLKLQNNIKVWHAGCSTGEEIFTLAIILKEENLLHKTQTFATDMNKEVLKTAMKGVYPIHQLNQYAGNYLAADGKHQFSDYYQLSNGKICMDTSLIENVTFKNHNLAVDKSFSKFDLILFRNVMIYFNQELQNQVIHSMHQNLFMNGYLAVGAQETIEWCKPFDKFATINYKEKIYKKVEE